MIPGLFFRNCLFGPRGQRGVTWILALVLILQPIDLRALPDGAQVQHGQVNIATSDSAMNIDQLSQTAVVNWNGFSINANELVAIKQLGTDSALLNRVTGADPSKLLGQLSANGRVYVVNPNGLLVGEGARINTQQFIASALDVADQDFLNGGDLTFKGDSQAPVVNLGHVTAANGDAILIAQVVRNEGEIKAPNGTAALAAGSEVLFQPDADQKIVIASEVSSPVGGVGVENTGLVEAAQAELKAAGGNIYDLAINQDGIVQATGIARKNGRVLLTSDSGEINHHGRISAHNVDGSGGEVLIGGDAHGANAAVANAGRTRVSADAVVDVSAISPDADAGRAIVWADGQTDFAGKIEGQGGTLGGDGAFAEVSGKRILNYTGLADLSAANGETGTLLLDPENAVISTATDDQVNGVFNNSVLETNLVAANVVVDASGYTANPGPGGGQVIVNAPVSWTSGNTLTLQAETSVQVNADLTGTGGDIVFLATNGGGSGGDSITVDSSATITADSLSIGQNNAATFPGMNPPPLASRTLGGIAINGTLDVDTLDFRLENSGIGGAVTVDNAANKIGTITTSVTDGALRGQSFTLVDGDGDLTVDGDFSSTEFNRDVTITTSGDLTLTSGTKFSAGSDRGTVVLASTGGSFINNAGASAVTSGSDASSRYLIYSDDPANTTKGGLTGLPVYNKTYGANAPGTITQTGNRFLYALAPTLTFTADDLSRGENTANPTLTYTVTGLVGGDSQAQAFSGVPSLSTAAVPSSPAGDYTITLAQNTVAATDFGYGLAFVNGTLTIDLTKIINIKADDFNRYYGDANPAFTYTPTGFVGGDDASILSGFTVNFSTTAMPSSPAGTFAIVPSGSATVSDYDVTYQNGTLTVDPRLLTITADAKSMNFLDSKPAYTATWSGLASFDTEADVPGLAFTDNYNNHAGSFTITPSGAANPNYAITFVDGTLTVNPRPVTFTAHDKNRDYGDANPSLTYSTSGMPFGTSADTTGLSIETTAEQDSVAGTYTITLGGATNIDYDFTYVPGTLTIDPADFTVQANNASRVYGDANPAFSSTNSGFKLTDTITEVVPDLGFTTSAGVGSNVGTYTITPTGTASANYDVDFLNGTLTVTKAPISLFALGTTHRTYGDTNPSSYAVNVVGLKNGDTLAGGAIQYFTNTTANQLSSVGNYAVNFAAVSSVNYSIPAGVQVSGTLVIDPRPLTITANSFTREYGDANPTLKATFDNLASFDTAAAAFPSMTISTPATQSSGVLDYGINIFNANNANYDVTTVPGTLSVTAAPITFGSADFTFMYGDNPSSSVAANYTGGLKLSDTVADLGAQVSAGGAKDVGTYPVTVTLNNSNYYVSSVAGSITINPRPVYFRVGDAQRIYGEELGRDYVITATGGYGLIDPLDQVFEADDPTTIRSDVGIYLVGGKLINSNYQLLGVDQGILRITPRVIAIKPENAGHTYGDSFAGVNYLVTGRDGLASFHAIEDVVADTILTQYTAGRNFGFTYAYELLPESGRRQLLDSLFKSGGDLSHLLTPGGYQTKAILRDDAFRNYYVISAPGTLSVVPRPVTLRVENAIGVKNNFINPFISFVDNLATIDEGQTGISIFEDLTYELVPEGTPERVQTSVEVTDVPSAPAFTDADFMARYTPEVPSTPAPPPSSGGGGSSETVEPPPGSVTATEIPIQIDDADSSQPVIIEVESDDFVSITSKTIVVRKEGIATETPVEEDVDSRLLDQVFKIRPANFAHDNYIVADVKMGTLTIKPDPVEVGAALEERKIATLRELLYNPGYTSEGSDLRINVSMALGFTRETIDVALDAIRWIIEMQRETTGGSELFDMIRHYGASMVENDNRSFTQDLELYIYDLHFNPETQAFVSSVLMDYSAAMIRGDVVPETDAQRAYKAKLESYMDATQEGLARKIKEKRSEWENRTTPEGRELYQRNLLLRDSKTAISNAVNDLAQAQADFDKANHIVNHPGDYSEVDVVAAKAAVELHQVRIKALNGTLADLHEAHEAISSPEAIAARIAAASLNSGDMAGTLFGGDVPYESFVQDAVTDLSEERMASLESNMNGKRVGAMASLASVATSVGAGAASTVTNMILQNSAQAAEPIARELAEAAVKKATQEAGGKLSEAVAKHIFSETFDDVMSNATKYVGQKGGKVVQKIIGKAAKKVAGKVASKLAGTIFKNATGHVVKAAGGAAGGAVMAGVGFAISTGISRAIIIGELADQEAFVKSLTENPGSRQLDLTPDPNVEGAEAVKKHNARMQVDVTLFKLGFMSMMAGENTSAISSGYDI